MRLLALWWFGDGSLTPGTFSFRGRRKDHQRVLIFNCTSGRSGLSLLGTLLDTLALSSSSAKAPFDQVVFCTNTTYSSGVSKGGLSPLPLPSLPPSLSSLHLHTSPPAPDLTSNAVDPHDLESLQTQHELAAAWTQLVGPTSSAKTPVRVLGSIEDAVKLARGLAGKVDALVCGSLHLVGGAMAVADLPLDL